MVIAVTV